jgi:retinol-binding protein 3
MIIAIPEISTNPQNFSQSSETPSTSIPIILTDATSASTIPLPPVSQITPLTSDSRRTIVGRISAAVQFWYVDLEKANAMAALINGNLNSGIYDHYTSPIEFAERLQNDIRSVYDDKHITLFYTDEPCPQDDPSRIIGANITLSPAQKQEMESRIEAHVAQLGPWIHSEMRGSIGYLKIDEFPGIVSPTACAKIRAAMDAIAEADSLIIDLSDNCGGDPEAVALLYSHLVDERELLNQIYQRFDNHSDYTYADPAQIQGRRFGGKKPIVCITSKRTFSAGEELAYDLQQSGRGTVIGQVTPGGANPGDTFRVDDHLALFLPRAKAINPHSNDNWEGRGVQPNHCLPIGNNAVRIAEGILTPPKKERDCCTCTLL